MEEVHAREMVTRITLRALLPVTASVLIHVGLVVAIVLARGWAPAAMPVLVAELVEAEAPPKPRVRVRPVTPPRPIASPLPFEPPPAPPEHASPPSLPEAPEPVAPEPPKTSAIGPPALPPPESPPITAPGPPAPPTPAPAGPAPSGPAPVSRPPVAAGPAATDDASGISAPARPDPDAAAARISRESLAAIPPEGVTQRAIPRGGYQYRPAYPSRARSLGIQGTTLLHVLVSKRGRVAEVVVKQSAGHPDLDRAATDAVRRWQFEPARNGTEAVEMWVQLPFEFRLR